MKHTRYLKLVLLVGAVIIIILLQDSRENSRQNVLQHVQNFSRLKWICYAPTHYDPKQKIFPPGESIREDLLVLKKTGFDGIITYECKGKFAKIPGIANEIGLEVILGVWGPKDKVELEQAVEKKDLIAAYCVGNEGLGIRYSLNDLDEGATYLSNRTNRPVAISEQIHLYFQYPVLLDIGDWIFPIVHPHFGKAKSFNDAIKWVKENNRRLHTLVHQRNQNKPIFIKEIGMPSSGDASYSEENQARFLNYMLRQDDIQFAVFEAFERTGWEYISPVEPYWGIFYQDRSCKIAAKEIQKILKPAGVPKTHQQKNR